MQPLKRTLDYLSLAPPEPFFLTLEAIDSLSRGEYLELWVTHEPVLLYPELRRRRLNHRVTRRSAKRCELLIWHADDAAAAASCALPER